MLLPHDRHSNRCSGRPSPPAQTNVRQAHMLVLLDGKGSQSPLVWLKGIRGTIDNMENCSSSGVDDELILIVWVLDQARFSNWSCHSFDSRLKKSWRSRVLER
jgi:hypothetical protein